MIEVKDSSLCCGCTACMSICPHDAIVMRPDEMGFVYPVVDKDKCVDCGLCEKVCTFVKGKDGLSKPLKTYGIRHRDENEIIASRSGGVFPALARKVIQEGGTVYGAAYDEGFRVVHKRADDVSGVDAFRGSKYVQSDMEGVFPKVIEDLKSGRKVLFSGTPCQVAGLKSMIPAALRENILLVDIVCHGVPSPYVWRDYLAYQEKKHGGTVESLSFRDKKYGWKAHKESFTIAGNTYTDGSYTYLFYEHVMLRDSCHVCPYSDVSRVGDVTLADFWGWQKSLPDFNADDKGVSLVLCSTSHGVDAVNACLGELDVREVVIEDCLQPNLMRPSAAGKNRAGFVRDYPAKGLEYVMKRYGDKGWRYKVYINYMSLKRKLKGCLGK